MPAPALVLGMLLGGAGASAAQEPDSSTATYAVSESTPAVVVDPERQKLLVEMWRRRILDPGVDIWTDEESSLLARMTEAEALGAFTLLRDREGTLRGYAMEYREASGVRRLLLMKNGYRKYVFLMSQSARKYFELRGTEAKFVFQIRAMDQKRVFDPQGILTPAGQSLYHRILRNETVQWRSGPNVMTNGRPSRPPPQAPAPAAPPPR